MEFNNLRKIKCSVKIILSKLISLLFSFMRKIPFSARIIISWYILFFYMSVEIKAYKYDGYYVAIIFSSMIIISWLIINEFLSSCNELLYRKKWITYHFFPKIKIKSKRGIMHKSYALSNLSMVFMAIAIIASLWKLPWWISAVLFFIQIVSSLFAFFNYYCIYYRKILRYKWIVGILFTFSSYIISVASNILSRKFVTSILYVVPEKVPTITNVIYLYVFAIFFTYFVHFIIMFSGEFFNENKRRLFYTSMICYAAIMAFISIWSILIINGGVIINYLVSITYQSDTTPYFKCGGYDMNDSLYEKRSGYLNIANNDYLMIYEDNGIMNVKYAICEKGSPVFRGVGQ